MKLIHCADIHLDSPMETHMTAGQASARNTEIISSFIRMTKYARENGVRAVIIAGDLFDGERVRANTVDEILHAVRRTPGIDYLYLPGNHDEASHVFFDHDIPPNLKQFGKSWTTFSYEDAAVSGIQICAENAESLYENIPHAEGCANIAVLHGQAGTACGTDRINLNLLKGRGIDYLALGHLHSYSVQPLDGRGVYCYSGCLEGRGFDECGEKGFVLLTAESGRVRSEFVPFCSRQLHRVQVDITGLSRNPEIAERMKSEAAGIRPDDMVEFILMGSSEPESNVSETYLQNLMKDSFFFCRVKNESRMAVNPEDYRNDISLKGEFIRLVLKSDASGEDKAAMIRAGMQALTGEEIEL